MNWAVLVASAVFEAVWATALGYTDGLTVPVPTAIFLVALAISLGGLSHAMKTIPVGVAYATWVGIGAALTVAVSMVSGVESVSIWKIVCIAGIVGCVIGLKLTHPPEEKPSASSTD